MRLPIPSTTGGMREAQRALSVVVGVVTKYYIMGTHAKVHKGEGSTWVFTTWMIWRICQGFTL